MQQHRLFRDVKLGEDLLHDHGLPLIEFEGFVFEKLLSFIGVTPHGLMFKFDPTVFHKSVDGA